MKEFDVIVIGSGPGGYVAAVRAAQLGLKTACVEKNETLGGTCLNVGCIPSKALLESSEHYAWLQHSGKDHGVVAATVKVDFPQMMNRKTEVVKGLTDGVANLLKKNQVERILGTAQFVSPNEIKVGNETYRAKNFILATGSVPIALPFLKFDEKQIVSSTGALSLKEIPKALVVIGGGVIGVELASVYNRLGSKVTVVEMLDQICGNTEAAVSRALQQALKKQGIEFYLPAKVVSGEKKGGQIALTIEYNQEKKEISADVVLVAVGRKPYSESLDLAKAGVDSNTRGQVPVDGLFRTNQPHIYAIGDLIDGPMLAHKASEEGYAVAEIIAGNGASLNYQAIPNVVYTNPEVASVGLTEKEAKEAGLEVFSGQSYFRGNARARCQGETEGLVKVVGDKKSGRLIGLHILGPHASEMIGEGVVAIESKMTVKQLAHATHAHPTLSEAIKEAALTAIGTTLHG
jgi:dihydrolipoamide dehydrogenase